MNSDMSIRISACSLSNMNSASALASSVFPTPVGPRKMKDPIGLFGSWRPERALRRALETAAIPSSCPMTRCRRRSSIRMSFWTSLSIMRETGIPVQLATTSATSSASTSSFSICLSFCASASFPFSTSNSRFNSTSFP